MRTQSSIAFRFTAAVLAAALALGASAAVAVAPPIHVEGRHLVDPKGNCVRLAGVMHPFHPFFCGNRWGWGHDDATAERCVDYFDKLCAGLMERKQGLYANMIRITDDGYWCSDDRKKPSKDAHYHTSFDRERFNRYVDRILVPVTENAVKRGLYVVIRPSYCAPGEVRIGDSYHRHIVEEWSIIAADKRIQAMSGQVLLELQNEPVTILTKDGEKSSAALPEYCQKMMDMVRRRGFKGVVLVPGSGYQSNFRDFAEHPIKDPLNNYGYAVHVYPGWYAQHDGNADPDRFMTHFVRSVPVVKDYPCVVTECDWSPECPGKSKLNEFGQEVKANFGTWGTASTSKWGNAYLATIERLGNVSTICGDINLLFKIDDWLKEKKITIPFDGNPECSPRAFFDLYAKWGKQKPAKPSVREANRPRPLDGIEVPLKHVRHLTTRFFRMSQGNEELHIPAEGGSLDFGYGPKSPVGRSEGFAALFKAVPRKEGDKTYYQLRCYDTNTLLRTSWLDGGNGDTLCVNPHGGLIVGVCRENGNHRYGQDQANDGLWEVTEGKVGFTFRNVATGKYLGEPQERLSQKPVSWTCVTRAVPPKKQRR